ncbi:hypothetical protein FHX82_003753 [Amycolatopsis bartoniae]|uniref:hypothetical protein n=1 Tax=Amycolatopsis bartoniae TaxID=941986 RepID=UPI001194717C|nr:hypothetical protein [Amycolatopsis bartoniae]MBB2936689.1 hypothetical protein [Amycolatopsis bartoniae]TVT09733.1 hypothetical protein FNH07_07275 [Amycolatopsis bartoniae]
MHHHADLIGIHLAGEERPSFLAAAVAEAAERFDLDLHGLDLPEAMRILGEALPGDTLCVVGDIHTGQSTSDLRDRGFPAQTVLAAAAALAPAPVTADLLVPTVAGTLGSQAPMLVGAALDELACHGLVHPLSDAGTVRRAWRVPEAVTEAARQVLDPATLDVLAARAATVLSRLLAAPAPLDVFRHALAVAGHRAVPRDQRELLLRAVATGFEQRGDSAAARDVWLEAGNLLAAARLADPATTVRETAPIIQRARRERDVRTEHRARFLAAMAHDQLGRYAQADKVFHAHPLVSAQGPEPVWLDGDERREVRLGRVRALRLRGEHRQARALLDTLLPEIRRAQPHGSHRGDWPVATLEDARLLQLAGDVPRARDAAGRLVELFGRVGWQRHPLARAAVVVLTEGEHSPEPVRRAVADSVEWFGEDDPRTLELRIVEAVALRDDGEPAAALAVLADAETRATARLGEAHPLTLRMRRQSGVTWMAAGNPSRAARIFEELLPDQDAVLGASHPEARLARLDLGVCLARTCRPRLARPLLKEAAHAVQEYGPWQRWICSARATVALAELPGRLFPGRGNRKPLSLAPEPDSH